MYDIVLLFHNPASRLFCHQKFIVPAIFFMSVVSSGEWMSNSEDEEKKRNGRLSNR
jgi:hypothetical protein